MQPSPIVQAPSTPTNPSPHPASMAEEILLQLTGNRLMGLDELLDHLAAVAAEWYVKFVGFFMVVGGGVMLLGIFVLLIGRFINSEKVRNWGWGCILMPPVGLIWQSLLPLFSWGLKTVSYRNAEGG